jgi:general secretion pathway protein D
MKRIAAHRRIRRPAAAFAAALIALAGSPSAAADETVNFSFDQADIRLMVRLVGEATGKRFAVAPGVEGEVTVYTPTRIPASEVYPFFLKVLESRGFSVVRDGDLHRVVPLPERALPAAPVLEGEERGEGLVTRIVQIEHVSAVELARTLAPMVRGGAEGALTAFGATNHLILTDTADSLDRLLAIVRTLDRPGAARAVEVVVLKHAAADEIARQVAAAMEGAEAAGSRFSKHLQQVAAGRADLPGQAVVVPSSHANAVLLIGSPVQLGEMKRIVESLDVESPGGSGRLHAVFLKYMAAEEAAAALTSLLGKSADESRRAAVAIEPDIANNALLIEAAPRDYEWVRDLLEKLDRVPQQVLVEIVIAEVTVGNRLDLGVEWATVDQPGEDQVTIIGRSRPAEEDTLRRILTEGIFPQGLAVGIATDVTGDGRPLIPFYLTALAQNRDVNILSRVPLWAQNNKEATVSVVDNIPVLTSTIEGGAGTSRDVIQNIERLDVGIKLSITPHVNPNREVTLQLNPSIEAIVDEGPADRPFTPTIAKREVQTTVTVPDRATIVISGLIREDRIQSISKVPLLGDLPVLGALFRRTQENRQRSNLLIFVTPNIVTDMKRAREMKEEWEARTRIGSDGKFEAVSPPGGD